MSHILFQKYVILRNAKLYISTYATETTIFIFFQLFPFDCSSFWFIFSRFHWSPSNCTSCNKFFSRVAFRYFRRSTSPFYLPFHCNFLGISNCHAMTWWYACNWQVCSAFIGRSIWAWNCNMSSFGFICSSVVFCSCNCYFDFFVLCKCFQISRWIKNVLYYFLYTLEYFLYIELY